MRSTVRNGHGFPRRGGSGGGGVEDGGEPGGGEAGRVRLRSGEMTPTWNRVAEPGRAQAVTRSPSPAAARSASALSTASHVKSASARPKCP